MPRIIVLVGIPSIMPLNIGDNHFLPRHREITTGPIDEVSLATGVKVGDMFTDEGAS